jgi:hypothetical protein
MMEVINEFPPEKRRGVQEEIKKFFTTMFGDRALQISSAPSPTSGIGGPNRNACSSSVPSGAPQHTGGAGWRVVRGGPPANVVGSSRVVNNNNNNRGNQNHGAKKDLCQNPSAGDTAVWFLANNLTA